MVIWLDSSPYLINLLEKTLEEVEEEEENDDQEIDYHECIKVKDKFPFLTY